jgi:hypothetical protein
MQTLTSYLASQPKRTDQEWAEEFGISRSHFTEIRLNTAQPGKNLMMKIEQATGGKVPVASWFSSAADEKAAS